MQKQNNSGKASNNVIKFVTPKLLVVRHVSSPQGSSLYTKQSANYGLLLTNILLANILATECMIRMWWTGNLAVLRSYMKWAVGTDTTCRPACTVASKFLSGEYSA
jgi:6-phosphogluconate dehydrogenase